MVSYDEQEVAAYGADCYAAYQEAKHPVDSASIVWLGRMIWDACAGLGWTTSRAKHLAELRAALGLPPDSRPMPPDIDTDVPHEVDLRIDWALWASNNSEPIDLWRGYIDDVANEGHRKGWTSTGYWRVEKISKSQGAGKGYTPQPIRP